MVMQGKRLEPDQSDQLGVFEEDFGNATLVLVSLIGGLSVR